MAIFITWKGTKVKLMVYIKELYKRKNRTTKFELPELLELPKHHQRSFIS